MFVLKIHLRDSPNQRLVLTEELTCTGMQEVKKDWEKDYDKFIAPLIEENTPCYILYRLDEKTSLGHAWLLLSYVPETATIRQKMLYASTKATLKLEFGSSHIKEELHATTKDETTLQGYYRNKKNFAAPAPLTSREEELNEIKKTEVNTDISTDTRHQTLGGINFPLTEAASNAIKDATHGLHDYLQFKIDLQVSSSFVDLIRGKWVVDRIGVGADLRTGQLISAVTHAYIVPQTLGCLWQ